jgi:hypothetical protein
MKPRLNLPVSQTSGFATPPVEFASLFHFPRSFRMKHAWPLAAALIALPLAAQQPYGYNQYSAQAPPNGYAQPQPQYAQPQYNQPQQYAQPQYNQQPQYSQQPQYAQPQGNADPQYAQPQYPQQDQQQADAGQPYPPDDLSTQQPPEPTQQPLSAGDLEQLLAPIALYPDNLVAQILAASTYPAQVASADQWVNGMTAQGYGSPDQIAAGADAQSNWDPSVKALTAFPQVLDMLNHNLQWTTALGNAYYNQPQDVMQTIQVLRQRAQQAGNLQNTPQEDVTQDQGYIDVAPENPQVEYLPSYDPWDVYGAPVAPYPGFSLLGSVGSFFGGPAIQFGLGIGLRAFEPFGWMAWGLDWLGHAIFCNHSAYYSHSRSVADWGLPHGGPRAFGGRGFGGAHQLPGNGRPAMGNRTPQPLNGYRNGQESARGGSYQQRPGYNSNGGAQRGQGYAGGNGYTHPETPGQMAYNRVPQQLARPQAYGGQAYAHSGYGYDSRPAQGYAARPGMAYGSTYGGYREPAFQTPANRAPQQNYARSYTGRGNEAYGQSFARNESSGGFRGFSGGRESSGFRGGGFQESRAPKGFSGGSHFSGGGGHFSGGGHSSGGGHASGGGHSGGGGGHHR